MQKNISFCARGYFLKRANKVIVPSEKLRYHDNQSRDPLILLRFSFKDTLNFKYAKFH